MNKNNLIQKVASIAGRDIDGDTVHLIESYIPSALNKVCGLIAENRPVGHEFLFSKQTFLVTTLGLVSGQNSYRVFQESQANPRFIMTPEIHQVEFSFGTDSVSIEAQSSRRAYRVGSFDALRLAEEHRQIYYYVQDENIIFAAPSTIDVWNVANSASLIINHYIYATIDTFPEVLEEYLLKELVSMMPSELTRKQQEEINK